MQITQDYLKSRLDYNKDTGVFTWKRREGNSRTTNSWNSRYAYTEAGSDVVINCESGLMYRTVGLDNKRYRAHRLAWLYVYGEVVDEIDHIDGDGLNNKISNLRQLSHQRNIRKGNIQCNNTSGYKGVSYRKDTRKWIARAKVGGKYKSLGSFTTKEEAFSAYCSVVLTESGEVFVDLISKQSDSAKATTQEECNGNASARS